MSSTTHAGALSLRIRTLECRRCGAPLQVPAAGASGACGYCSAPFQIERRPLDPDVPNTIEEGARLAALVGQRDRYDIEGGIWRVPDGLGEIEPQLRAEATRPVAIERLRRAWREALGSGAEGGDELRRVRLGLLLGAELLLEDPVRARAVWESTLDAAESRPHRDALRARLAVAAARVGELDAAAEWLASCDPRPLDLESETERRLAQATLALARGQVDVAVERLGMNRSAAPIAFTPRVAVWRAHALASVGREDAGRATLDDALTRFGDGLREAFAREPGPGNSTFAVTLEHRAGARARAELERRASNSLYAGLTLGAFPAVLTAPFWLNWPPLLALWVGVLSIGLGRWFVLRRRAATLR